MGQPFTDSYETRANPSATAGAGRGEPLVKREYALDGIKPTWTFQQQQSLEKTYNRTAFSQTFENAEEDATVDPFRFQIKTASETAGSVTTPKITLVPGTVDSMSQVIGTTAIDTDPAPKLELTKDVKNIIVLKSTYTADTATADGYTYLLNNGTLTDPEILAYEDGSVPSDTDPTPAAPAGTYYLRIGYVNVDADGIITGYENDGVRTSLVSHYCAGSSMWYSTI